MPIMGMDGVLNALDSSQKLDISKVSQTGLTAGRFHSLWLLAGNPGAGAIPPVGAGEIPTNLTVGALNFVNPDSLSQSYLGHFFGVCANPCLLIKYDRLIHTSGLSGAITTPQSINTPNVNRTDIGAEIYIEVYSALGTTASNVTAVYTNELGITSRTTIPVTIPASVPAGFMLNLPLQIGDKGVRSIQSVTLATNTGVAGNFGVTVIRRIAGVPFVGSNFPVALDAFGLGMPRIPNNSCLALMMLTQTSNSGVVFGTFSLIQG